MKLLTAALLVAVAAAAAASPAQSRSSRLASPTDAAAGKQVFEAQCAWCHGTDGDGGTGPNLHGRLRHVTDYRSIVEAISNGIPGTEMPGFRSPLTERSIRQAAAYVQSLSRSGSSRVTGNAQHGADVYAAQRCASCHIANGDGGILGPELTDIGARRGPTYLREAIVKPEASHPPGYLVVRAIPESGPEVRGIRVNEDVFWIQIRDASGTVHSLEKARLAKVERQLDATLMPSYAGRVPDSDLDDLVAYLVTLRGGR